MFLRRYRLALAFLPVLLASALCPAAPLYNASFLPDADFSPYAMNNAGQIAGTRYSTSLYAVLYDGSRHDVGIADAEASLAYGINTAGAVTGVYLSLSDSNSHAFVYQDGITRDLGAGMAGYGINRQGTVVGVKQTAGGSTGFIEKNGAITEIGNLGSGLDGRALAVNDHGQVVGDSTLGAASEGAPRHSFLYSDGALLDLGTLGQGGNSSAVAINNAGQVAGFSDAADGTAHAFLYDGGVMRDLGGFGTSQINIYNLNQHGRFVGTAVTGAGGDVPFISLSGKLIDLNTLIDPTLGWELYGAYLNNDLDQIIAGGCHDHVCGLVRLDLIGAVPEPDGAWLLIPGLGMLAGLRRRQLRNKTSAPVHAYS